ncbi:MAG: D-sedoheptulose 7-phosphate isomerase [Desulfovibrionaceae bacterium]|nr:D-sedoheptulose 7-phosphate isomerase [Desulfovibrionaceae bacterium]
MRDGSELILAHAREGMEVRERFFSESADKLDEAAYLTAKRLIRGGKVLLCGNGGSAADCQHIAGEFVNRFLIDRPALPALALTTDTSVMTAIGNDSSFTQVFARQVEAFGKKDDVLFAITTSGNSANVLEALRVAREKELLTIGLTGRGGGKAAKDAVILLAVPSDKTPIIQEVHLACEHLFCQLVDHYLFENVTALTQD